MKRCPACAEQIQDQAVKCPHCREELMVCPYCAEWTQKNATTCSSCGETVKQMVAEEEELSPLFECKEVTTIPRLIYGGAWSFLLCIPMILFGGYITFQHLIGEMGDVCGTIGFLFLAIGLLIFGATIYMFIKMPGHDYVTCMNCENEFLVEQTLSETKCSRCGLRGLIVRLG